MAHVTVECKHLGRLCSDTMAAEGVSRDAESGGISP